MEIEFLHLFSCVVEVIKVAEMAGCAGRSGDVKTWKL